MKKNFKRYVSIFVFMATLFSMSCLTSVLAQGSVYLYDTNIPTKPSYLWYETFNDLPDENIANRATSKGWFAEGPYLDPSANRTIGFFGKSIRISSGKFPSTHPFYANDGRYEAKKSLVEMGNIDKTATYVMSYDTQLQNPYFTNGIDESLKMVVDGTEKNLVLASTPKYISWVPNDLRSKYRFSVYSGTGDIAYFGKDDFSYFDTNAKKEVTYANSDKWITIQYRIDFANKKISIYVIDKSTMEIRAVVEDKNFWETLDITNSTISFSNFKIAALNNVSLNPENIPIANFDNFNLYRQTATDVLNVDSVTPLNDSNNVNLEVNPTVTFDSELLAGSVNKDNFKLYQTSNPKENHIQSVNISGKTVTIVPKKPLLGNTNYTLELKSFITGINGLTLGSGKKYNFTTVKSGREYLWYEDFTGRTDTEWTDFSVNENWNISVAYRNGTTRRVDVIGEELNFLAFPYDNQTKFYYNARKNLSNINIDKTKEYVFSMDANYEQNAFTGVRYETPSLSLLMDGKEKVLINTVSPVYDKNYNVLSGAFRTFVSKNAIEGSWNTNASEYTLANNEKFKFGYYDTTSNTFVPQNLTNTWVTYKYVINFATKKMSIYLTNKTTSETVAVCENVNFWEDVDITNSTLTFGNMKISCQVDCSTNSTMQAKVKADNFQIYTQNDFTYNITRTYPENNNTDVAVDIVPSFDFSTDIDPTTAIKSNISLYSKNAPTKNLISSINTNGKNITLSLSSNLKKGTDYVIKISKGLLGTQSEHLTADTYIEFTTIYGNENVLWEQTFDKPYKVSSNNLEIYDNMKIKIDGTTDFIDSSVSVAGGKLDMVALCYDKNVVSTYEVDLSDVNIDLNKKYIYSYDINYDKFTGSSYSYGAPVINVKTNLKNTQFVVKTMTLPTELRTDNKIGSTDGDNRSFVKGSQYYNVPTWLSVKYEFDFKNKVACGYLYNRDTKELISSYKDQPIMEDMVADEYVTGFKGISGNFGTGTQMDSEYIIHMDNMKLYTSNMKVVSVSPADNSKKVALNSDVIVTFDRNVDTTSLQGNQITVKNPANVNMVVSYTVLDNVVTVKLNKLANFTEYTMKIPKGIKGTDNVDMKLDVISKFTTVTPEEEKLTLKVVRTVPSLGDNLESVGINSSLDIEFNEELDSTTIKNGFAIKDSTNNNIMFNAILKSPKVVTVSFPNDLEKLKNYSVIVNQSLKTTVGNYIENDYTINFKTNNKNKGEVLNLDFNSMTTGIAPTSTSEATITSNGSVVVDATNLDNTTHKNAVHITGTGTDNASFVVDFKGANKDFVSVKYDVYLEKDTQRFSRFGSVNGKDKDGKNVQVIFCYDNAPEQLIIKKFDAGKYDGVNLPVDVTDINFYPRDAKQWSAGWHSFEYIFNKQNNTFTLLFDNTLKQDYVLTRDQVDFEEINQFAFSIANRTTEPCSYWVDNVAVRNYAALSVTDITEVADGTVKFTFNENIDINAMQKIDVVGLNSEDGSYAVTVVDNTATVTIKNPIVNKKYNILINCAIGTKENDRISMLSDVSYMYTLKGGFELTCVSLTDEAGKKVDSIIASAGKKVTVTTSLINRNITPSKAYFMAVVLKNSDNVIKDISTFEQTLDVGKSVDIPVIFSVPAISGTQSYKVEIFVWESSANATPIFNKTIIN